MAVGQAHHVIIVFKLGAGYGWSHKVHTFTDNYDKFD